MINYSFKHRELDIPRKQFADPHVVLRCVRTLDLYKATANSFRSYVPIEREVRDTATIERPAIPGYIFVPLSTVDDFVRYAHPIYNVRIDMSPLTEHYRLLELADLHEMQRILNEEFSTPAKPNPTGAKKYTFSPGDKLIVLGGNILEGLDGTFVKYKGGERGRIECSSGYADVPLRFLNKV